MLSFFEKRFWFLPKQKTKQNKNFDPSQLKIMMMMTALLSLDCLGFYLPAFMSVLLLHPCSFYFIGPSSSSRSSLSLEINDNNNNNHHHHQRQRRRENINLVWIYVLLNIIVILRWNEIHLPKKKLNEWIVFDDFFRKKKQLQNWKEKEKTFRFVFVNFFFALFLSLAPPTHTPYEIFKY